MDVAEDAITEPERERSFIQLYMNLTGVTESAARAVFMYAGCKENIYDEVVLDAWGGAIRIQKAGGNEEGLRGLAT